MNAALTHVALHVADFDGCIAFYEDYCGMRICHQCLVTVDGVRDVRACMTVVRPGMKIETRWRIDTNEAS